MTKVLCVRFDIDTVRCIDVGVPGLLALGVELDAPFTFFINMGRAADRRALLGRSHSSDARKLARRTKVGVGGVVHTALLNPRVGLRRGSTLRRIVEAGHELGLHGGRNHATWHRNAAEWPAEKVRAEVRWGLAGLTAAGLEAPPGFASPGWTSPSVLAQVLAEEGFAYAADDHGPGDTPNGGPITRVRTALTGEPGGVGYLESLAARRLSRDSAMADFRARLSTAGDAVALYDHPCWAGNAGLTLLRDLIGAARTDGYEIVTIQEAIARGTTP